MEDLTLSVSPVCNSAFPVKANKSLKNPFRLFNKNIFGEELRVREDDHFGIVCQIGFSDNFAS